LVTRSKFGVAHTVVSRGCLGSGAQTANSQLGLVSSLISKSRIFRVVYGACTEACETPPKILPNTNPTDARPHHTHNPPCASTCCNGLRQSAAIGRGDAGRPRATQRPPKKGGDLTRRSVLPRRGATPRDAAPSGGTPRDAVPSEILTLFDIDMLSLGNLQGYTGWFGQAGIYGTNEMIDVYLRIYVQIQMVKDDITPWSDCDQ
jgi:hypothetical protein